MNEQKKLTVEDIVVPEQCLRAISAGLEGRYGAPVDRMMQDVMWAVRVALLAITLEPVVPSEEEADQLIDAWGNDDGDSTSINAAISNSSNWQRRAFLRRDPFVPEGVKAILEDYYVEEGQPAHLSVAKSEEMAVKIYELGRMYGGGK